MQKIPLGISSLLSSRLAYGCWRLAGPKDPSKMTPDDEANGRKAAITAYEAGYTLFDNADIYAAGHAERILGDAIKQVPGMRDKIIVATKCGVRRAGEPTPNAPGRYDFDPQYILKCCEESLKRLKVETIDLYQLHRADLLADPAAVAEVFAKLKDSGKVRYFGVSNFQPSLVTAMQSACPMPLVVHQVEISIAHLNPFLDGTLDQCLTQKMTPLAWSPLARGVLGDGPSGPLGMPVTGGDRIVPVLDAIAKERGTSRMVVALSWLLKHPSKIIPIVGSTNPGRIREALKAADLELTREEWYRLLLAGRGEPLP